MTDHEPDNPLQAAERDIIAIGLAVAAIIMLVGTGGSVLPKVLDALFGNGQRRPPGEAIERLLKAREAAAAGPPPRRGEG